MVVHRLKKLVEVDGELMVQIRWRGLPDSEDTLNPIKQVYDDVPTLLEKLLSRKNPPSHSPAVHATSSNFESSSVYNPYLPAD